MIEWSEEQRIALDAIRKFVNEEVVPHADALDQGDMLPYDIIRKMSHRGNMDLVWFKTQSSLVNTD
jgi:hypothetical protein